MTKPSTPQRFNMSGPRSPWQTPSDRHGPQARQHQSSQQSRICLSESQIRERRHPQQHIGHQDRCGRSQQQTKARGKPHQPRAKPTGPPVSTPASSLLRAATASPVIGRAATPRQSRSVVWELPISRHDHRARRCRSPAEHKTTDPIHLDMNRAPTTTFAGRPYNV